MATAAATITMTLLKADRLKTTPHGGLDGASRRVAQRLA
jgi:hypothetical protein